MNKSMPCLLCITDERVKVDSSDYNYHEYDRILKNIHKEDEYEVFYSGQNKGKLDYQLINAIEKRNYLRFIIDVKKVPHIHIWEKHIIQILFNIENFL
jgi:hypothetical protein